MDESDAPAPGRRPLRSRVREAGGWYAWINANLIRAAGPAAVGPYETTPPPTAAERAERACPLCGQPVARHTFDRSGPKPLMHCPRAGAGAESSRFSAGPPSAQPPRDQA